MPPEQQPTPSGNRPGSTPSGQSQTAGLKKTTVIKPPAQATQAQPAQPKPATAGLKKTTVIKPPAQAAQTQPAQPKPATAGLKKTTVIKPPAQAAQAQPGGSSTTATAKAVTDKNPPVSRPAGTGKTTTRRPIPGRTTTIRPGTGSKSTVGTTTYTRPVKSHRRRNIIIGAVLFALFLITGPFPVSNAPWQDTDWGRSGMATLNASQPGVATGALMAGTGIEEITPEVGQPLMGYSDRKPLECTGTLTPCYVRALTLGTTKVAVTIVSVDSLLVLDDLAAEVLKRTGLRSDDVFFTATHTHSGPGGWAQGLIVETVYGKYNPTYFNRMAEKISKAIQTSRSPDSLRPASLAFASADASSWVSNRIYNGVTGHPALGAFSALIVKETGKEKPRAILTSFAAHATVIRREEHRASADYPGEVCRLLQKKTGAEMVMFAAGAVGDARPLDAGADFTTRMATGLINHINAGLAKPHDITFDKITTWNVPVALPQTRVPCGAGWSWLPFIAPQIQPAQARISFLRLGNFALCGWPADIAGEVAAPLQEQAAKSGLTLLMTSFNGNWRGYVTLPETYESRGEYETRMAGLLGPQAGAYFTALTKTMIEKSAK